VSIQKSEITGLVLAGGRGSRMGGADKGLQSFHGNPMALHALMRLGPQVGRVMVNANRNLAAYEAFGVPVFTDATADHPGPLAGFMVGLEQCETPWLVTVPCDSPNFPADLVERLAQAAIAQDTGVAIAAAMEGGVLQAHPVFCLMKATELESLVHFMQGGGRKIDAWTSAQRAAVVSFDDAAAFANANTLDELRRLG
jgi:molybdenum cofactor guanylyltransferase